jgi:hypothetical protein
VGHEFPDRGRRELVVAGAGSALHPKPDDPRGNHLQVIRVYDDGSATLDSLFYSAEVRRKPLESYVHPVIALAEVGRRRRRVFRQQTNLAVGELRSEVRITEDGYTVFQDQLRRCEVVAGEGEDHYALDLYAPAPAYLRHVEVSRIDGSPPLARLEPDTGRSSLRSYHTRILFDRTYQKPEAFSLSYRYHLMNGHALSYWEFQRKYKDLDYEYVSLPCFEPADALMLAVEFPARCPVDQLQVDVAALFQP